MLMKRNTQQFLVDAAAAAAMACSSEPVGIGRTWNDVLALAGRYAS